MELQSERLFDFKLRVARRWLLPLLVVVLVVGIPAFWFGPPFVSRWRQERLLERARMHSTRDEIQSAAICLRRVLALNSENLDATRELAFLAEKYMPSEAPALWERVSQIVPNSSADAIAWARAALRVGQIPQAEAAFERMQMIGESSVEHHEIGARIALATGRFAEARAGFARALELDSSNERDQLEVASQPDASARRVAGVNC
jgi:tetratricopeptide (TPR) repeat protein